MAFSTKFSLPSFLKQVNKLTANQKDSIKRAGFGNLLHIPNHVLRRSQLIEFMETWSIEKQAFIFPPGEIKMTLLDVALILGLRVIGEPVTLEEHTSLTSVEKEFGASVTNRNIGVESLKDKLESIGDKDDESFVRVFLLYCFGTLLFPTANGKVDSRYLCLLQDMDNVSCFAWGAAVLNDLHDCLSQRKSKKTSNISGCLILLQIWCYEHIVIGRPKSLDYLSIFPRVCRWESSSRHYSTSSQFTIKFADLGYNEILWTLEPTSEELKVDLIKEIPQECYLRTVPGTIEEPIVIESERKSKMVRAQMEEQEESTTQQKSTIFLLRDEESKDIQDLEKEILELKMVIEEQKQEIEVMKRVKDENEELRKIVQDEEVVRKRVKDENEELRKIVQDEEVVRKRVQEENQELKKLVEKLNDKSILMDKCFSNLETIVLNDNLDDNL